MHNYTPWVKTLAHRINICCVKLSKFLPMYKLVLGSFRTKNNVQRWELQHALNPRNRQTAESERARLHVEVNDNVDRKTGVDVVSIIYVFLIGRF